MSEFLKMSHKLFVPSWTKLWFIALKSLFPFLFRAYDLPFVSDDIQNYFLNLTDHAIELRQQSKERPDDFFAFLLRLKEKKNFVTIDIAAHTATYFLDVYETSSVVLTHALYRLAQNKRCQTRLRQEIDKFEGRCDAEVIADMKYLDHVFNGAIVHIPIYSIHNDPLLHPNPR